MNDTLITSNKGTSIHREQLSDGGRVVYRVQAGWRIWFFDSLALARAVYEAL
jgi:hypothetical protein